MKRRTVRLLARLVLSFAACNLSVPAQTNQESNAGAQPASSPQPAVASFWSAPQVNLQPLGNLTRNIRINVLDLRAAIDNAVLRAEQETGAPLTQEQKLEMRYDVTAAAVAIQGHLNQPQFFGSIPLLWIAPVNPADGLAQFHRDLWTRQGGTLNVMATYTNIVDLARAYKTQLVNVVNWNPDKPWTLNIAFTWAGRFSGVPVRRGSKLAAWLTDAAGGSLAVADLPGWFYGSTDPLATYNGAMDSFLSTENRPPLPYMIGDAGDGRLGVATTAPYAGCAQKAKDHYQGFEVAAQLYARDYVVANRGFHVSLQPHDWQRSSPFGSLMTRFGHPSGLGTVIGFPAFEAAFSNESYDFCEPNKGQIPYSGAYMEWSGVKHASQNRYAYDVGALGPVNASVLAHWPVAEQYEQPWVSYINPDQWKDDPSIISYATIVVGDYDSADWFSWDINEKFRDEIPNPQLPLGWEVSPLVAGRVPLDFDWLLQNIKRGSAVIGSNSGAGYMNPDYLPDRREALNAMLALNRRFGINIMGYALNGHYRTFTNQAVEQLATAFPGGVVTDWQYNSNGAGVAPTFAKGHNYVEGELVAGVTPVITQAFNFNGNMVNSALMTNCATGEQCVNNIAEQIRLSIQTGHTAVIYQKPSPTPTPSPGTTPLPTPSPIPVWFGSARPIPFQVIHANRVLPANLASLRTALNTRQVKVVSPVEFFARLRAYMLRGSPRLQRMETTGSPVPDGGGSNIPGARTGAPAGFTSTPSAPCAVNSYLVGRADSSYHYSNDFLNAYCRYGGAPELGLPANNGGGAAVHWWTDQLGDAVGRVQDFGTDGDPRRNLLALAQGPNGVWLVKSPIRQVVASKQGLPKVGFPKSDVVLVNGRDTQYFERAFIHCTHNTQDPAQCQTVDVPYYPAPHPFDRDGDRRTDLTVLRPGGWTWHVRSSNGSVTELQFGLPKDLIAPGDYDGDSKSDFAVVRPEANWLWYINSSRSNTTNIIQWGLPGDIPVPADYDGDNVTDLAVVRPSDWTWHIRRSRNNTLMTRQWGLRGDIPVPGDYDGDGSDDLAVWRPASATWFVYSSLANAPLTPKQWGFSGDVPVPGDYDGDYKIDFAVWRPGTPTATWHVHSSLTNSPRPVQSWGFPSDKPVPGYYDADNKIDLAVWRPSTAEWYIVNSSTGQPAATIQWGLANDVPVPLATTRR